MNYKNSTAARTTITRNLTDLDVETENIYKSIFVLSRRANQVEVELREELHAKLEEFATTQDNLEEIFENREQIEVSKFYERLPKPAAISIEEFEQDKVYVRAPEVTQEN